MGRRAFSYKEYVELAQEKGLKLLSTSVPSSVRVAVKWQELLTGVVFEASYTSVRQRSPERPRYSRYTAEETLARYYDLAEKLGIIFLYDTATDALPANTKEDVKWKGKYPGASVVTASYHRLSHRPSSELLLRLGVYANANRKI